MHPSDELLDEGARRWLDRVGEKADELETLALEWRLGRDALAQLPSPAAEIDPTSAFALPHAAVVMDVATQLCKLVAQGRTGFQG